MFDIEGEGFIPVERFRTILKEVDEDFTEDELDDIIFEVGLIITIINITITIINLTIITEDELGDIMRWVETVMWRPIRRRKYLEDREMIQASFRLTQMAPERSISMSLSRS